jgi:hypothetical protein
MYYGFGWKKNRRKSRDRKATVAGPGSPKRTTPISLERLLRVSAKVQNAETREVITARVFLYDLSPSGVSVFLTAPLSRGDKVFLVIEHPRHLFIGAEIAWCGLATLNTRVISPESYGFRAYLKFDFETAKEQEAVLRYCMTLSE